MFIEVRIACSVAPHEVNGNPDLATVALTTSGMCEIRATACSAESVLLVARNSRGSLYEELMPEIKQLAEVMKGHAVSVPFKRKTTRTLLCKERGRLRATLEVEFCSISIPRIA